VLVIGSALALLGGRVANATIVCFSEATMKVDFALEELGRVSTSRSPLDWELVVSVFSPGAIGGTPCIAIKNLNVGFDWDAGKVMIETEVPLTALAPEDVAAIRMSAKEGQSWHAYQSYKKQADRIKVLEAELAALKASR
jgi:hypothetical protein